MIPLYGFLEGDTLGLLMLAKPETTLAQLAQQLRAAARVRTQSTAEYDLRVVVAGVELDSTLTVEEANLGALERFDVRRHARTVR